MDQQTAQCTIPVRFDRTKDLLRGLTATAGCVGAVAGVVVWWPVAGVAGTATATPVAPIEAACSPSPMAWDAVAARALASKAARFPLYSAVCNKWVEKRQDDR